MKQKDLLFMLVSVTFLVLLWIIFGVVHRSLTSTISGSINEAISPISGTFDIKTLEVLKNRQKIIPQTEVGGIPTPTPSATPTPVPTTSPLQSLSVPVASGGGTTR